MGVNGVNLGYTKKGNAYQKSTIGRKVGTALGTASFVGKMAMSSKLSGGKVISLTKDFIKNGPSLNDIVIAKGVDTRYGTKIFEKAVESCKYSKSARVAFIAGTVALAAALTVGVSRLIGRGVDGLINRGQKKKQTAELR